MSQPQCFQSLCFLLLQIQIPWLSCLLLFSVNCKQPRKAAQCPASLLLTYLLCQISSSVLKLHGHKASKAFKLWWRYLYCTFPCSLIQFHLKPHHNDLYNPCFATTKKNLKDISDFSYYLLISSKPQPPLPLLPDSWKSSLAASLLIYLSLLQVFIIPMTHAWWEFSVIISFVHSRGWTTDK